MAGSHEGRQTNVTTPTRGARHNRSVLADQSRRRFVIASAIAIVIVAIPYIWVLTDLWNSAPSFFRTVLPRSDLSNFYDIQARAMLHGHLSVPKGSLGEETFIHDGRQYTYFGIFPSLLRIPVLLFTHALDGRLTAISIFLAWLLTGIVTAMLIWRVRTVMGGSLATQLGRIEVTIYATVIATVLGGSILMYLAASPWVYSEDIAWSIALTVSALFALVGVLEAPSRGRVIGLGFFVLAAVLTRGSTGYGCVLGVLLASGWFLAGRGGEENKRWWWPVLGAGLIPLVVAFAISWAKFGVLYGYPLYDQVYFRTHHQGRINHGAYFSVNYLATSLKTYLGSSGFRLTSVFPFISLPEFPVRAVGHVGLFGTEEVTSIPGSMPLLTLLSIGGVIAASRARSANFEGESS